MLIRKTRAITKEQYDRAVANHGIIAKEDMSDIFSDSELWGYGVYSKRAKVVNGEYVVEYTTGNSCD